MKLRPKDDSPLWEPRLTYVYTAPTRPDRAYRRWEPVLTVLSIATLVLFMYANPPWLWPSGVLFAACSGARLWLSMRKPD